MKNLPSLGASKRTFSILALATLVAMAGCGSMSGSHAGESGHKPGPEIIAKGKRAPKPEQKTPNTLSAPKYCSASVAKDQAIVLQQFVVDVYNKHMKDIDGFRLARTSADGAQPRVSFTKAGKPLFKTKFANKAPLFHVTLCYAPDKKSLFACEDEHLQNSIAAHAATTDAVKEYEKFYQSLISGGTYHYEFPLDMGRPKSNPNPLFVVLPLKPKRLLSQDNKIISSELHISLAKIYSHDEQMETPEARALKEKFAAALREEFPTLEAALSATIKLETVECQNKDRFFLT